MPCDLPFKRFQKIRTQPFDGILLVNNNNINNNYYYYNNPNILLITKLTIKSYLQLISLKKLFSQSTIYIIPQKKTLNFD